MATFMKNLLTSGLPIGRQMCGCYLQSNLDGMDACLFQNYLSDTVTSTSIDNYITSRLGALEYAAPPSYSSIIEYHDPFTGEITCTAYNISNTIKITNGNHYGLFENDYVMENIYGIMLGYKYYAYFRHDEDSNLKLTIVYKNDNDEIIIKTLPEIVHSAFGTHGLIVVNYNIYGRYASDGIFYDNPISFSNFTGITIKPGEAYDVFRLSNTIIYPNVASSIVSYSIKGLCWFIDDQNRLWCKIINSDTIYVASNVSIIKYAIAGICLYTKTNETGIFIGSVPFYFVVNDDPNNILLKYTYPDNDNIYYRILSQGNISSSRYKYEYLVGKTKKPIRTDVKLEELGDFGYAAGWTGAILKEVNSDKIFILSFSSQLLDLRPLEKVYFQHNTSNVCKHTTISETLPKDYYVKVDFNNNESWFYDYTTDTLADRNVVNYVTEVKF